MAAVNTGELTHWWIWSLAPKAAITPLSEVLLPVANWIASDRSPGLLSFEATRSTSQIFLKYLAVSISRKYTGATYARTAVSVLCLAIPWGIRCSSACCVGVCVWPVCERKRLKQRQGDLPFIPGLVLVPDKSSLLNSFFLAQIFPINWTREELVLRICGSLTSSIVRNRLFSMS